MIKRESRPLWAKRAATAISVASLILVVSGCTAGGNSTSSGSSGNVTLTFLTFETPNLTAAYWDQAIARTSAQVPGVTIKKLVSPTVDRTAYAKQLAASGQLPDIMIAVSPGDFVKANEFAAFDDSELTQFSSPNAGAISGKVYQTPWGAQPQPLVYYNKSMFTKAGITDAPKTYADFLADCAKLKASGSTPIEIGGGGSDTWADGYSLSATVATELYKSDPTFIADLKSGKSTFSDPGFLKAAQKVSDLAKAGYFDTAGLTRSYANTEQAFRDGKGAMYPMGNWFAASVDSKPPSFDVGVFAWPTDDGSYALPTYTGGGLSVSAKSTNVALAKKWALTFSTNKDNLDGEAKADGVFMAVNGYTPPTTLGASYLASAAIYNDATKANGLVNAFSYESGDDALPTAMLPDVYSGIADLINGKKTPQQFADALQASYRTNSQ